MKVQNLEQSQNRIEPNFAGSNLALDRAGGGGGRPRRDGGNKGNVF